MSYLTVIPLATAKLYLRVDDTLTEDDDLITILIQTACKSIERKTNHIFYAREKTYFAPNGYLRVYDYPINSVVSPASISADVRTLHTEYKIDVEGHIVLNVGYALADVPPALIQVALEMIDIMYYGNETNKSLNDLSIVAKTLIDEHKRFVL